MELQENSDEQYKLRTKLENRNDSELKQIASDLAQDVVLHYDEYIVVQHFNEAKSRSPVDDV